MHGALFIFEQKLNSEIRKWQSEIIVYIFLEHRNDNEKFSLNIRNQFASDSIFKTIHYIYYIRLRSHHSRSSFHLPSDIHRHVAKSFECRSCIRKTLYDSRRRKYRVSHYITPGSSYHAQTQTQTQILFQITNRQSAAARNMSIWVPVVSDAVASLRQQRDVLAPFASVRIRWRCRHHHPVWEHYADTTDDKRHNRHKRQTTDETTDRPLASTRSTPTMAACHTHFVG